MLRKLSLILVFAFGSVVSYGQGQGTLQGKIKDKATGEPLAFVNLVIEQNGVRQGGTSSDFDGNYKVASITPGTYTVKAMYVGYNPYVISGVVVSSNKITFLDIQMESGDVTLEEVTVIEYAVPLIDKDGGASGATVTRDDIARMPGRSATSIAQTVGGVFSQEGSGDLSIRGSRSDASYYFIDGIKVRGSTGLPKAAIEEVSVITGGLPANYGDATGGVISITTRGASKDFFGGIDYLTSGFHFGGNSPYTGKNVGLDRYAYNLIEGSLSGPLWVKKDSTGKKMKPILGFFASVNYTNIHDTRPFFTDQYVIKEDKREELLNAPLRPTGSGFGTFYNTDFLRSSDFQKVRYRQNAQNRGFTGSGKIDVNLGPLINLTFGGSFDYNANNAYDYNNMLFNTENNGQIANTTWRIYGRFTQRFASAQGKEGEKSSSVIKNAYYSVMVDYSKFKQTVQDANHKDRLFNYGYVGQFTTYRERSYEFGIYNGSPARIHNGFRDTLVTFSPYYLDPETQEQININPDLAAITNQYYQLYTNPVGNYQNLVQIQSANALRNGDQPQSVYNLWTNIGQQYNSYGQTNNSQFRITASGNADIGNHAVSLGFEYEQRDDRAFNVSPIGLWTIGRQLANGHTAELDVNNPSLTYFGSVLSVDYEPLNSSPGEYDNFDDIESQSFFDYNIRKNLGLNTDGVDFLDIDAYNPAFFQLGWFSANELLNNGNNYVSYYGYSYSGERQTERVSFEDFFTARDEFGNKTRPIAPFQPIYVAGYIMDKFAFDDLIFNVGLRVDRFDANQNVLQDRYLLYQAKTVKEVNAQNEFGADHPTNMGDDYVVYVNTVENPTAITGYRDGRNWYNSQGEQVADPTVLFGPNGIAPYLVNPNASKEKDSEIPKAFRDYKPQINVMPRVAFSFPISDEALFFAHYDVLTKRPTTGNRLDILDYYFMDVRNVVVNNPDLMPEKTIDYELGYQQVLTKSSSLKISAFYRELRNQVALINVTGAYPRTYRTYGNLDFGTIKGLTLTYDLRRTGNMSIRMSYTLQFAEGTGSDANSALNLVNSGQPNLRTIYPFEYDQRHALTGVVDYRYGEGKHYKGPKIGGKNILENTGANVVLNVGSGTPYSAQQFVTPQSFISGGSAASLAGQVNGSRKPGQFRMDMQIDRNFTLKFGKEDKKKEANLNIYLQVNNVLNTRNILNVYGATGNANDDGYLSEARYQNAIAQVNSEQSYREYYAWKTNNPYNYGLPRTIRLGIKFDF
ncbi:MAG: TonB-dependent receptor domain-containing protein [Flavobacteriales bacterium]